MSATSTPPTPDGPDAPRPSSARVWGLALVSLLVLAGVGLWASQRRAAGGPDASIEARPLAAKPPTPQARAAYQEGMALMQQYRWVEAVPFFKKAAQADSTFALPPLRLTVALYFLGDSKDVIAAMTEAVRLANGAPDAIRLRVEPHYFWYQGQWEKCAAAARALRDSEPDNFEALFPSLLLTGCVPNPESLAVMARLRASGSVATRDARFDLSEARLAFAEHEDRRAAEALDRAEAKATGPDNRFLEAAALRQRSRLDSRAGRYDLALQRLAKAEQTYVAGGYAFEAARVAGERAEVLEAKGEFLEAAAEYERQLKLLENFGATYAAVLATKGGAADYLAAGEPLKAAALLERVKAYPQRILQNVEEVYASVGRVALEKGDLAGAAAGRGASPQKPGQGRERRRAGATGRGRRARTGQVEGGPGAPGGRHRGGGRGPRAGPHCRAVSRREGQGRRTESHRRALQRAHAQGASGAAARPQPPSGGKGQ